MGMGREGSDGFEPPPHMYRFHLLQNFSDQKLTPLYGPRFTPASLKMRFTPETVTVGSEWTPARFLAKTALNAVQERQKLR